MKLRLLISLTLFAAGCLPPADMEQSDNPPLVQVVSARKTSQQPEYIKPLSPEKTDDDSGPATSGPEGRDEELDATPPPPPSVLPAMRNLDGLFCGAIKHESFMRFWPRGNPLDLVRKSSSVLFYDSVSMPGVYQVFDQGAGSGAFRVDDGSVNANNEFPWNLPAGVPSGSNVKTIRFVQIPEGRPILWWRSRNTDGAFARFRWQFQEGTRLGELILITNSRGLDRTAELRTRVKKKDGTWSMQAYRPFPTREDFNQAAAAQGVTFEGQFNGSVFQTLNSGHQRDGFLGSGWLEVLPAMAESTVDAMLDATPFKPSKGLQWDDRGIVAPTAASYSAVPVGFFAGMIPVDNQSCMRCHDKAGEVVNLAGERRWRLRGSDGIFSFHPFDPSSIGTASLKLNPRLVENGLLFHAGGLP